MNDTYAYGCLVILIKDVANLPGLEVGKIYKVDHTVYGESGISGYRIRERETDPNYWAGESWFVYPYEIAPVEKVEDIDSELIGKNPNFVITDEVGEGFEMGGTIVEEKIFGHDRYNEIVDDVVNQIKELSEKKGGEYAGDVDRLANFRRNAKNLDLNMEDIWSVYAAKHWDAIQQYVKDLRSGKKRERLESISGRAHDLIVYLILFLAMVEERNN